MAPRVGKGGGSRRGAGRTGTEGGARSGAARPRTARQAPSRSPRRSAAEEPGSSAGALDLVGHEEARARAAAEHAAGRLAPVLLVTGPKGVGKESFGFWVARLVLCSAEAGRPCGSCPSCVKTARLQHPDVHWFFPVPSESSFGEEAWARLLQRIRDEPLNPALTRFTQAASFRMHQAVDIRRLSSTTSFEGRGRVFVLGDYEQNPSDQVHNALLKVLEEPPPRTTFVLTTSRPQGLPATILSRCRRIRLAPLSDAEMERFLDEVASRLDRDLPPDRRSRLVAQAEGRPGRALELLGGEDPPMAEAAELLREVVEGGAVASYAWAMGRVPKATREDHDRRLDALAALWRDLLRVRAGVTEPLVRPDLLPLYEEAARKLDPARAAAAALHIEHAREQIQANAYAQLVFWRVFRELAVALEDGAARAPELRVPRVP